MAALPEKADVTIIGGGIVGCATGMALAERTGAKVVILEAENKVAAHQTGHNSGVIHSGLYYKPGSMKAKNCTDGREALIDFCDTRGIEYDRCGKIVVATNAEQVKALDELERRGLANGLDGMTRLTGDKLREYEPHVNGIDGLHVPQTGIINYSQVTAAYADVVREHDGEIVTNAAFTGLVRDGNDLVVETVQGRMHTQNIINCGGLQSDRIARACGVEPGLQIVPFRGEYYDIKPERQSLVNNLIYPVPDARFPFLGVHFTRMIEGGVEAGPNAVLAFKREGYSRWDIRLADVFRYLTYPGFWKMALKYWKMGTYEMWRSFSKRAFVAALQELIPEITMDDVTPGGAGVRAQALLPDGSLADDFKIVEAARQIHVLNAPSPAATASISIGRTIAEMAEKNFTLPVRVAMPGGEAAAENKQIAG